MIRFCQKATCLGKYQLSTLLTVLYKYIISFVQKYHEYNVDVVRKDGLLLVRELAAEVKNHMDFKINAVMVSAQYFNSTNH